jgi:hypothetical protein
MRSRGVQHAPSDINETSFISGDTESIWVEKRALTLYFSNGVSPLVTENPSTLAVLDGGTEGFSFQIASNESAKLFRIFELRVS